MQGFGLPQHPGQGYPGPAFPGPAPGFPGMGALPDPGASLGQPGLPQPGMGADPAQLQQLVQLLGAKMLPKQTAVVECPKSMVGRVIGKGGETIKSLQQYTGAMIQIDQSTDPTRVTIAGSPQSLQLAVSMVNDIVRGTFKGFAMLRQIALSSSQPGMPGFGQPQPVYVQGYGFVPPSQVYNPEDPLAAATMLRSSPPTGPLTPPMTPLRGPGAAGPGGLTPEALAALLGQQQAGMGGMPGMGAPQASQDALLGQLLGQLSGGQQQQPAPASMALPQHPGLAQQMAAMQQQMQGGHAPGAGEGTDSAAIQALLAQAGLLTQGGGAVGMGAHAGVPTSAPGSAVGLASPGAGSAARGPGSALSTGALSTGTASPTHSLSAPMPTPLFNGGGSLGGGQGPPSARGAGSYLGTSPTATHSSAGDTGSGRTSPAAPLAAANPALVTRRPGSDTGSPLGRYGAVGSPSSQGAASSGIGAAAEEALVARMGGLTTRDLGVPTATSVQVAEQGPGAGMLPPGWAQVTDGQGLVYYVNHVTQESSLTRPTASPQGQAAM